jgi:DNA modification methylase
MPFEGSSSDAVAITNHGNSLEVEDRAFHNWYRFVLSFPPHLVRDYLNAFDLDEKAVILDPFCGTGTTVVEAKLGRIRAIGVEANPFPHFAASVKVDWSINPAELREIVEAVAEATIKVLRSQGIDDVTLSISPDTELWSLPSVAARALIKDSISPIPLHKTLVLLEQLGHYRNSPVYRHCLLALGRALVNEIGNLRFGPEVGVGKIKRDVPVVLSWKSVALRMGEDLSAIQGMSFPAADVHLADARNLQGLLPDNSIDAVITSPPYPNEKDYTRTTRLESVILGFFSSMSDLRMHKKRLLRSNTRGVYKSDDDDTWIRTNRRVQQIADMIEARRVELGKTSGFEKLYPRVVRLYFGGMARHLAEMTPVLREGANLAYVVGDQASYLRVMIRTGEILAEIAEEIGYQVQRIDLFRTRFATATQEELREEVVVLRWPGKA